MLIIKIIVNNVRGEKEYFGWKIKCNDNATLLKN